LHRRRIRPGPKASTPSLPQREVANKRPKTPIKSHNEHDGVLQHIPPNSGRPPAQFPPHRVSVVPEILEPIGSHLGVSNRVLDIFVAHVVLERSGVMPIVGELEASRVPEHVGVNRECEPCRFSGSGDHFEEACSRGGTTALGDKDVSGFHILPAKLTQGSDFLAAQRMNVIDAARCSSDMQSAAVQLDLIPSQAAYF
jgi:hypothetical protein